MIIDLIFFFSVPFGVDFAKSLLDNFIVSNFNSSIATRGNATKNTEHGKRTQENGKIHKTPNVNKTFLIDWWCVGGVSLCVCVCMWYCIRILYSGFSKIDRIHPKINRTK